MTGNLIGRDDSRLVVAGIPDMSEKMFQQFLLPEIIIEMIIRHFYYVRYNLLRCEIQNPQLFSKLCSGLNSHQTIGISILTSNFEFSNLVASIT